LKQLQKHLTKKIIKNYTCDAEGEARKMSKVG